jgi:hypothetical protein
MRILQSIDVDESNPEYIAAKEKQRAKLKGRFESLFAKYEALPEAMTDEIDMRTGEIVVDRGHMRRLNREYMQKQGRKGRKSADMLDDLFRDDAEDAADDSTEEDTRDELAPSQSPEPRNRKRLAPELESLPITARGSHVSTGQIDAPANAPLSFTPAGLPAALGAQASVPSVSSPATNWMQMVQFPQTPAGQMAQSEFMQQIQHAVQQAITPILSNMLSVAPTSVPPIMNAAAAAPVAPARIAEAPPVTLPILPSSPRSIIPETSSAASSSPPHPAHSRAPIAVRSSPLPVRASSPQRKRLFAKGVYIKAARNERTIPTPSSEVAVPDSSDTVRARVGGLEESRTVHHAQKAFFDDTAPKRPSRKSKLPAPGASLGEQSTQPQEKPSTRRRRRKLGGQADKSAASQLPKPSIVSSRHLPTPDSLEHDEARDVAETNQDLPAEDYQTLIASGGHFDPDDRELLSIADEGENIGINQSDEDDTAEMIIPSIETETPTEHDATIQTSPTTFTASDPIPKTEPPHPSDSPAPPTSTPNKPKKKLKPISFQVDSDSEADLDLVAVGSPSVAPHSLHQTHIKPPMKKARGRPRKHPLAPTTKQTATDTDDELLLATPKTTVTIKRESHTPPASFLLATPTIHTPRSAPQPSTLQSSGAKAKATPLARSVFLKRVKQSWAKGGSGKKAKVETNGLLTAKRKRLEWEDDGSEDELAL